MTMITTIPQAAPRGLDVIIEDVQQRAACPHCSAGRTQPCALPRPGGCHMARFARARREGLITAAEMAAVIKAAGVFTNGTVIRSGGAQDIGICPCTVTVQTHNGGELALPGASGQEPEVPS